MSPTRSSPAESPQLNAMAPAFSPRIIYGFMVVGVLTGLANGIAKIAIPLYAIHLHASAWQIGIVGSVQFAGTLLLSLPIGALIDRHGSLPLFRFGGIVGAMLYLFAYTRMTTAWDLIIGVTLFGLVNPFRMVATQAEFLHLLPLMGYAKAGWQRASHSVGMFLLGPMIGALLVEQLGFSTTFYLVSASMLVAVLVGNQTLSFSPAPIRNQKVSMLQRLRDQWGVVASQKDLRDSLINEFISQLASSYFSAFAVLIGLTLYGFSASLAATLVVLQGAAFVFTLLVGGTLATVLARSTRMALGYALILAGLCFLGFAVQPYCLWVGALLLGVGVGWQHLTNVECFAAVTAIIGRGRAGGMFNMAGPSGGVAGAFLGGLIAQHYGYLAGFQILAAGYGLLMLWQCARLVFKQRRPAFADGNGE